MAQERRPCDINMHAVKAIARLVAKANHSSPNTTQLHVLIIGISQWLGIEHEVVTGGFLKEVSKWYQGRDATSSGQVTPTYEFMMERKEGLMPFFFLLFFFFCFHGHFFHADKPIYKKKCS